MAITIKEIQVRTTIVQPESSNDIQSQARQIKEEILREIREELSLRAAHKKER